MSDEHHFPNGQPVPDFLKPADVSQWLDIHTGLVYDAIKNGDLKCKKLSRRKYIVARQAVLDWLNL